MARKKNTSDLTTPRSRTEEYLAKIAGLSDTMPEAQFSRLERYLKAIADRIDASGFTPTTDQLAAINSGATEEKIDAIANKMPATGGENLLVNSLFVGGMYPINPLNKTGTIVFEADKEILIPGWRNYSGANASILLDSYGIKKVSSGSVNLVQRIYGLENYLGQHITVSYYNDTGGHTFTMSIPELGQGNGDENVYIQHGTDPVFGVGVYCVFLTSNSYMRAIKVEFGNEQSLYNDNGLINPMPEYTSELSKACSRMVVVNPDAGKFHLIGCIGKAYDDTRVYLQLPLTIPMRGTPIISYTGNLYLRDGANAYHAVTSVAVYNLEESYITLLCRGASNEFVAGEIYELLYGNSDTGTFIASC